MGIKSTDSNSPYYDIFGPTAPGSSDAPLAFLPPPEPFSATGGTTYEPGNGYKYHKFTSSGSLVGTGDPQTGVEVLIVAGGGGGGSYYGGGGGGGGVVIASSGTLAPGTYPVTIGTGGPGGSPGVQAPDGNNSSFDAPGPDYYLLAKGGGGGAGTYYGAQGSGRPGGCGGGSGGGDPSPANGQATQPGTNSATPAYPTVTDYGFPGGFSVPSGGYATAGGGGASGAGGSSPGNVSGGGNGGAGQPAPGFEYPLIGMSPLTPKSPTNNHFAGGGGGRVYGGSGPAGSGTAGVGGGGQGFPSGAPAAIHATDTLGGGGGGTHPGGGGDGGDGIVVVRYPTS
jgi:hypothetical protein